MLSKKLLCLFLFGAVLFEQTFGQEGGGGEGGSSEGGSSEGGSSEGGSSEGGSSEGGSSEGGSGGPSGSGGEGTTDTDDTSTSSSSSSSDSSACFDSNSIVKRQINNNDWEYALLKDIKLGDYVLSSYEGETVFSEVLHRLHYLPNDGSDEEIGMKKLCSESSCITMTGDHLLYVNGNSLDNLINAAQVKIGDLVYNENENDYEVVVSIEETMGYPRDVLTRNGNIIVNNILASSYIGTNKWDHIILSKFLKSLHYLANDMPYLYDIIADGQSIWQYEEFTMRFHQAILFMYFNVYQAIIDHIVTAVSLTFGVALIFGLKQ